MAKDEERRYRMRNALREARLDAVITSDASEVLLLTGYWPIMGASVAIFTADADIRLVVPSDEQELAATTSGEAPIPYEPLTLHQFTSTAQALEAPLTDCISSLRLTDSRVGIQMHQGTQPMPYITSTLFRGSLTDTLSRIAPRTVLASCDALIEREKAVKTPTELDIMRRAMRIASDGFREAPHAISPALREPEVAAAIQSAFDISPSAAEAQRSYGTFFCMSGPNSASASAAYARTRQRVIADGDLVMIHANTCCDGYWTDVTRTYTAGTPSDRHAKMREAITEARQAAVQAIRPGVPAREVDSASRDVMGSHGFGDAFRHGLGHGVGFAAANATALPRMHPLSPDVLQEGMTFNIEPAAYFDGYGGMRHCDVVAVTATGAEILTQF